MIKSTAIRPSRPAHMPHLSHRLPPQPFVPHEVFGAPPLPEVVEDDSEAAWEMWLAAQRAAQTAEADTQPMDLREDD